MSFPFAFRSPRMTRRFQHHALNVLTWGLVLVTLSPVAWMVVASLSDYQDVVRGNLGAGAFHPKWKNYVDMRTEVDFLSFLRNSLIICGLTTLFSTVLASMAAYSLARFRFRGNHAFSVAVSTTQVIPGMLFFLPLYMLYIQIDDAGVPVMNTYHGMVFLYTAMFTPASIWIMRGFFVSIPRDLEEAALLDGCSRLGTFIRIVLPISTPGIIATAAFVFLLAWDEVFFAWVLTSSPDVQTVPVGLRLYMGQHATRYDLMMAAAVVSVIPVLLTFFLTQRWFVKGLAAGAVKG
jgi:multiple sugar transport system permease protein